MTVTVQHLTIYFDGGVILLIGLLLIMVVLLARKYKQSISDLTPYGVCEPKKIHTLFCSEPIFLDTYFNC